MEGGVPEEVCEALAARGHEIRVTPPCSAGKVMGIRIDRERGVIHGAASPKNLIGYAIGW